MARPRPESEEAFAGAIEDAIEIGARLGRVVESRTLTPATGVDEEAFYSTHEGHTTITNRYDLEKAVPNERKPYFREIERYWVNEPYAFVVIFHSERENERKYYTIEPYSTTTEDDLVAFLSTKLRMGITYSNEDVLAESDAGRRGVIEDQIGKLLSRYDLYEADGPGRSVLGRLRSALGNDEGQEDSNGELEGIAARPESSIVEADRPELTDYQFEKLRYRLLRDFTGYAEIDPIKHDVNIEDISCDGYDSPVFVYHTDHEQLISNVSHGREDLDDFVVKLAQRSGKGISKRQPQVDATLPDGSRAQLTLGNEVSDHGTNYTIRQFKDVPFTPVDLVNWNTFGLDEMSFLWLCIEHNKSMLFAGGTASGKTTSLNAMSLFIPSKAKIVTIEDTRELEMPQRNWVASMTRPSFTGDDLGNVDEFDLLEAALRQRPEYIVMGEVRGEEGRTLFQVMSTGHTSLTTFHADNVGEVLKRFTTDPINVSKTLFTALDLVSVQTATRVGTKKVRRSKTITEINHYDSENDEINVQDVYQWQAETDEFLQLGNSSTLEEIRFDRGWDRERLRRELFERKVVLSYLIDRGIKSYTEVAATLQAYINDPDTILALIANDRLEGSLEDLRGMESVSIDTDPEAEAMVPRPDPGERLEDETSELLERAETELFTEYEDESPAGIVEAFETEDAGETADAVLADGKGASESQNTTGGERTADGSADSRPAGSGGEDA